MTGSPEGSDDPVGAVLQFLREWQTLIAAVFVLWSVRATYDVDRQRADELAQRVRSLTAAVSTEIALIGKELSDIVVLLAVGDAAQKSEGIARLRSMPPTAVWGSGNQEIHHLPPDFLAKVIEFHFALDEVSDRLTGAEADGGDAASTERVARLRYRLVDLVARGRQVLAAARRIAGQDAADPASLDPDRLRELVPGAPSIN